MANYVSNKIICSEKFFNDYFIDHYYIGEETKEVEPYISFDKLVVDTFSKHDWSNGGPIYYGYGWEYQKKAEGLIELKLQTKYFYPIKAIVKAINLDNSIKWYCVQDNYIYLSKFTYDFYNKKVKEEIIFLDEHFENYLGYILDNGLNKTLNYADDEIWYYSFKPINKWVEWETRSDNDLLERYGKEMYPSTDALLTYRNELKSILDIKAERLVEKYKDLFTVQNIKEQSYVNKKGGRGLGCLEKLYWTRIKIKPDFVKNVTEKIGCVYDGSRNEDYDSIQLLPYDYKINFDSCEKTIYFENDPVEEKSDDYIVINGGRTSFDVKTGNVHPQKAIYSIQPPNIKLFVLCRKSHKGPSWDGEIYNEYEFYKFKNCEKTVYIPKRAVYPSPEEPIEILDDDDSCFDGISDNLKKEIMVGSTIYIGTTLAFKRFLEQIGLLEQPKIEKKVNNSIV